MEISSTSLIDSLNTYRHGKQKNRQEVPTRSAEPEPDASYKQRPDPVNANDVLPSSRMDRRLLDALLNAQQAQYAVTDDNGNQVNSLSLANIGKHFDFSALSEQKSQVNGRIISNIGSSKASDIAGQNPDAMATDLIARYGKDGALSRADIEHAYNLDDASLPASSVKAMKKLVDADWNALSGGKDRMSREELATAITKLTLKA